MGKVKITWVNSVTVGVTKHIIYRDDIEIGQVVVADYSEFWDDTPVSGVTHKYEVQAVNANGVSVDEQIGVNVFNLFIPGYIPEPPQGGVHPTLFNFRVLEGFESRVYFDSSVDINGTDATGFTITGRSIVGISLAGAGLTVGHYFTINVPLNWWDNNTIKYDLGSDIESTGGYILFAFTKEHIDNVVDEPIAQTNRYVAVGGSGDGTSEGNAASISYAMTNASADQTWWIKKGLYSYTGDSNLNVARSGTSTSPIVFKGYDTVIGDLDDDYIIDYFDYVSPANALSQIDSTKFPVIQGDNTGSASSGLFTNKKDYLIFNNIQIRDFYYNFWAYGSDFVHFENCTAGNAVVSGGGQGFRSGSIDTVTNIRLNKCLSFDNAIDNIWINGGYSAILNSKAYSGVDGSNKTDYNIVLLPAYETIIKGCLSQAYVTASGSDTHGIGIKQKDTDKGSNVSYENLIVDNTIRQDNGEALYIAHQGGANNTIKRNRVYAESGGGAVQGLRARNGAHNNIFEDNYLEDVTDAINLYANVENAPVATGYLANDNTFRNNIVNRCYRALNMGDDSVNNLDLHGNKIYNNTFYNITGYMWVNGTSGIAFTNNEWKNNIVYGDGSIVLYSGGITAAAFDQQYNNYYNTGQITPSGTGNISVDPQFETVVESGFKPVNTALNTAIKLLDYDTYGIERLNPDWIGAVVNNESVVPSTADFFVAESGSDSNNGTSESTPWKTLGKVQSESSQFTSGKVIAFNGGDEFLGSLTFSNLIGIAGSQITFKSYGTGKAMIKATEPVTGWTNVSNIWSANISNALQVFKNNESISQGKIPKITNDLEPDNNQFAIDSVISSTIFICGDLIGQPDLVGATTHVLGDAWDEDTRTIVAFDSVTGQVTLNSSASNLGVGDLFYITDHQNLLTVQNDWFFSGGILKIYSITEPTGITATTSDTNGIEFISSEYVKVYDLEVRGFMQSAVEADSTNNIEVDYCDLMYNYDWGVRTLTNNYTTVTNNIIKGSIGSAVNINNNQGSTYVSNSIVEDNIVIDHGLIKNTTDRAYRFTYAFRLQGSIHSMRYNAFARIGSLAVRMYGANTKVEKNYVEDFGLTGADGGALYSQASSFSGQFAGSTVNDNIINQTHNTIRAIYGIYNDDRSTDIEVKRNTLINCRDGIYLHNTKNINVQENEIYEYDDRGIMMIESSQGGSGSMVNNILKWNNMLSSTSRRAIYSRNINSGDPNFVFTSECNFNSYYNLLGDDMAFINTTQQAEAYYDFAGWKAAYGDDANSTINPSVISHQVVFNNTKDPIVESLTGTWKDMNGNSYTDSITLASFQGKILYQN